MQYDYPSYSGFRCVACNIVFNSFDDQKKHYFAHHSRNVNPEPVVRKFKPKIMAKPHTTKPPMAVIKCDVCNLSFTSQVTYDGHLKGKRHSKKITSMENVAKGLQNTSVTHMNSNTMNAITHNGSDSKSQIMPNAEIICKECTLKFHKMEQLEIHISGIKHQKVLKMKHYNELMIQKDESVYCDACDLYLLPVLMQFHKLGVKHKRKCNKTSSNEPATKKRKVKVITNIEFCGFCNVSFVTPDEAVAHYQTMEHIALIQNQHTPFHCEMCKLSLVSQDLLDKHTNGFRHYVKVNRGNPNPEGEMSAKLLKMREKLKQMNLNKVKKKKNVDIDNSVIEEIADVQLIDSSDIIV